MTTTAPVLTPADQRLTAWQRLGTTAPLGASAQETLDSAGLSGWNVRTSPLTSTVATAWDENGKATAFQQLPISGHFATVRDTPNGGLQQLGVVGSQYHPVQNEQQISLLSAIVDGSNASFDAAGSIKGGRNVFVSMKMPDTMKVGGIDPVDLYLTVFNSHDGESSFRFVVTPIRTWCANMQAVATKAALQSYTVRHTAGGAAAAVATQARETLQLTFAYIEEFQAQADKLIDQAYTDQQFTRLTASLFPTPDGASERRGENQKVHRQALMGLFKDSDTASNIRGTRWAAFQAVTEYTDHMVAKAGHAGDSLLTKRAMESISVRSATSRVKERAFQLLTK